MPGEGGGRSGSAHKESVSILISGPLQGAAAVAAAVHVTQRVCRLSLSPVLYLSSFLLLGMDNRI